MRSPAVIALFVIVPATLGAQAKPPCSFAPNFFRLNSAPLNLHLAEEKPDQRDRMLAGVKDVAERTLADQPDNPVAWYYLARYYQETHNSWGADTAFARVEKLAPQCADTLVAFRKPVWNDAFGAGMSAWQAGKTDSAVLLLQLARRVLPRDPRADFQLGQLYGSAGNTDSALTYLNLGAQVAGTDTAFTDGRRDALRTAARLALARAQSDPAVGRARQVKQVLDSLAGYLSNDSMLLAHRLAQSESRRARGARLRPADQDAFTKDSTQISQSLTSERDLRASWQAKGAADTAAVRAAYAPAIAAYQALVAAYPATLEAAVNLAAIYAQSGHPELAAAAFDPVVAHPDQLEPMAALEAAQRMGSGGLGPAALKLYGVLLKLNPNNRNALAGEADALIRMHSPDALAPARKVIALDPSNQVATRALGQAFALAGQQDSARKYVTKADTGLTVDVTVTSFIPDTASIEVAGVIANLKGSATPPMTLTFDFLDAKGAVVSTQATPIAPIAPQATYQFDVKGTGKGIVAWRYRLP